MPAQALVDHYRQAIETAGHVHGDRGVDLTVIIPTRNRPDSLRRALAAIGEVPSRVEVVVIDDGSRPPVGLEQAGVRLLRNDTTEGPARSRNRAAREALGARIAFLDDDDIPLDGWIDALLAGSDRSSVGAVVTGSLRTGIDGTSRVSVPDDGGALFLGVKLSVLAGTFAVRRDLFEQVGGFDDDLLYSEFTELWARLSGLLVAQGLEVIVDPLPRVEISVRDPRALRHPASAILHAAEVLIDRYSDRFERDPRALSSYRAVAGHNALKLGRRRLAVNHFLASVRARPLDARAWFRLAAAMLFVDRCRSIR